MNSNPQPAAKAPAPARLPKRPREIQLNARYCPQALQGARSPAVFLVHDGFGETLHYRNLAQLLSPQTPVYGLHPMGANGVVMMHTRIKDIAASYVARIRLVQPFGPYLLGGLCAGGVIAHEMALQLQGVGETIGMLALMDACDVTERMRTGQFARVQIRQFFGAWRNGPSWSNPLAAATGLIRFATKVLQLLAQQVAVRVTHARAHLHAAVLRHCLDRGQRPPRFVRGLTVNEIYSYAASGHVVDKRVDGDLLLLRASVGNGDAGDEPFKNMYTDRALGWGRRVSGTVHCVDVGGGHYSMLEEPHVRAVAEQIHWRIDHVLAALDASSAAPEGAAAPAP